MTTWTTEPSRRSFYGPCVQNTGRAGPLRRSLGASCLRKRFAVGSPNNSSSIAGRMQPAVHFPCFAASGSLQGHPVQIGPAPAAAPTTTPPAKRFPTMPPVAPTENIRVFPHGPHAQYWWVPYEQIFIRNIVALMKATGGFQEQFSDLSGVVSNVYFVGSWIGKFCFKDADTSFLSIRRFGDPHY
jgi:hypothetical protein